MVAAKVADYKITINKMIVFKMYAGELNVYKRQTVSRQIACR